MSGYASFIPWTPEQHALLQQLHASGTVWTEIAEQCGHTISSCQSTLTLLKRRRAQIAAGKLPDQAFGKGDPKNPKRFWTAAEVRMLLNMITIEGKTFPEVDRALGRSEGASAQKFQRMSQIREEGAPRAPSGYETRAIHAPKKLPEHASLTAEFFGDPLPGRSALDRMRERQGSGVRSVSLATEPLR